MKTVCAGCNTYLSGDATAAASAVSHGICNPCLRRLYPEYAEEIIRELDDEKRRSGYESSKT